MTQYDKALRLYRSLGFKETDRYNDNEMADVFMLLDLWIGCTERDKKLECRDREGEELAYEDIEDAAEYLINGILYAETGNF